MGEASRRRELMGSSYGAPPSWAWHYTLGRKIPLILRDGALRDAWMEERPFDFARAIPYSIWFTTADAVDPTSVPALSLANAYHFDRVAFKRYAGGTWRIGFPLPNSLLSTYEEALALHPPSSPFGSWCRRLTSHGVNRKNWRIAWEPMPLTGCRIEEQQGDSWLTHAIDALPLDENGPGYGAPGVVVELSMDDYSNSHWQRLSRTVAC